MVLARFERDFTDEDGNLLTGNVSVEVRRMSGGLPQVYSDRAGAVALGNPFVNDGGSVAFHVAGNAYRVTATQGAFSRELTYVAIGLAGESDFTLARNQGDWSAVVTYARGDYVVHDGVGLFISTQDGNLNHEPDDATPASTAYWTYYPGLQGPPGPAGTGLDWQPGGWVTATPYLENDGVSHGGSSYICLVAHTSGTFATDLAANKWELLASKGDQGDPGNDGTDGTNGTDGDDGAPGADGTDPGVLFNWDDGTTDADPGAGNIRADNASLAAANFLFVSKTNRAGDNVAAWLLALASSTAAIKAGLVLTRTGGNAQATVDLTGVTDATGYVKLPITGHAGATGFIDTNAVSLQAYKTGDDGTGAVNSVNGETGTVVLDADDIDDSGTINKFADAGQLAKIDDLTVTAATDLDAIRTKAGHITVTQAVDLDAIETRVNQLDAAVVLRGVWDASAGTFPGGGTAQSGDSYIVSVAGTVNSVAFALNDRIIAITDNASTTTFAANWFKADYTDQVLSVAALTGAITAAGLKTALAIAVADITDATANGRSLISAANYAAMRALLDLEAGTDFYSIAAANAAFQAIDPQLSSLIRQNSQSAAYTTILTDGGKHIYHPAADTTARIWTIAANASVAYPIGTPITFDNDFGAGTLSIAINSDTLVLVGAAGSTGTRTLASGGQATAIKVAATRWRISGVGLT